MKKVTGTIFYLVIWLFVVVLFIASTLSEKRLDVWTSGHYRIPLLLAVFLFYSLWFAFIPNWAYGPQGIEIYRFAGRFPKKHAWADITATDLIISPKGMFSSWIISFNDKTKFSINPSATHHCYNVVTEVTRFIQIENPSVEIPERLWERLKGHL